MLNDCSMVIKSLIYHSYGNDKTYINQDNKA
uniref:Uncharacterized protein n=1 Tax=Myoviridae sp. ctaOv25 TaxID=2827290 RepID=A0A8S5R544_9CAUD|nr:MAG TPA: hypothetical protein [Myoviridae sp. ctaOv25]